MAIQEYQERIEPDAPVAQTPEEIHPMAAAFGGDIGKALESGAAQLESRTQTLAMHLQRMNYYRDQQAVYNKDTEFRTWAEDYLHNKSNNIDVPTKNVMPDGSIQKVSLPESPFLRMGNSAAGATDEAHTTMLAKMQETMASARANGMNGHSLSNLNRLMQNSFATLQTGVSKHEAQQLEAGQLNDAMGRVGTLTNQMVLAQDPTTINNTIDGPGGIRETMQHVAEIKGWGTEEREFMTNKYLKSGMQSSVLANLHQTGGDEDAANALIDKANVPEEVKTELTDWASTKAQQVRAVGERTAKNDMIDNRINTLAAISNGKSLTADDINAISIKDPELGQALTAVSDKKNPYYVKKDDEPYLKAVHGVFSTATKEQLSKYLINANHENANGTISGSRLAILAQESKLRASGMALTKDEEVTPTIKQAQTDAVVRLALNWADKEQRAEVVHKTLQGIASGVAPDLAYKNAAGMAIVSRYPRAATMDDLPSYAVGGTTDVKYLGVPSKGAGQFIFDEGSGRLKPNPAYKQKRNTNVASSSR